MLTITCVTKSQQKNSKIKCYVVSGFIFEKSDFPIENPLSCTAIERKNAKKLNEYNAICETVLFLHLNIK